MGNNSKDSETLGELRIEDYIWLIYIFLAIFAIVSNHYERNYLKRHNKQAENLFRTINSEIFIISFFIYLYFVYINYKHLKEMTPNTSKKDYFFGNLGLVASIFFLIGGAISLYISLYGADEDAVSLDFF